MNSYHIHFFLNICNGHSSKDPQKIPPYPKFNSKNGGGGGGGGGGDAAHGGGEVYCYYGLYKVEAFWKKNEKLGYIIFLVRLPGQKVVVCNELRETKNVYFLMKISPIEKKLFLYEKHYICIRFQYPSDLRYVLNPVIYINKRTSIFF